MILDARRQPLPADLACDVAIVGSGAAGIALALALSGHGLDIILIEAGGEKYSPATQDIYRTEQVSPSTHHLGHEFRRRAFGGTTTLWGGRCIPLDPIDFERRDWIPHSGWPIGYDEVARHIPRAMEICEAGPPQFDAEDALPGAPARLFPADTPDLILDRVERFSPPTDFGKRYRPELTKATDIRLLLNAPVLSIDTDPDGNRATGVTIGAGTDKRHIAARQVVLAAGGLETTRLLLASRTAKACGLGNERDLVGRFYQTHLEGNFGQLTLPRDGRIGYERSPEGVYCRRYLWLSPEAQRRERLAQLVLRPHYPAIADPSHRNPILSGMFFAKAGLIPEYARIISGGAMKGTTRQTHILAHLRNVMLGFPQLAMFGTRWLRDRTFARRKLPSVVLTHAEGLYPVNLNAEQTPNPESRVQLGDTLDPLGVPRLRVDWRLSELDKELLARGLRQVQTALAGTPARLELDGDLDAAVASVTPISHHMGTARMGDDPATGVCDRNLELFGTRGVYICGAAAFPTSGFANPTLTIVALSLRLAEHLRGLK